MPKIITRAEWGARAPKTPPVHMAGSQGSFVHHSDNTPTPTKNLAGAVKGIQNFHMDGRGWNDIAYSWLVAFNGDIYEGRGWGIVGAHTLNHNSTAHGYAFLGDGNSPIPAAAWESIQWLIGEHDRRYGHGFVKGHRDVFPTDCPGNDLYALVIGHKPTPGPIPNPVPQPSPGHISEDGKFGPETIKKLQTSLNSTGANPKLSVDGDFGPASKKALQARLNHTNGPVAIDGDIGERTIKALQRHVGATVDGSWGSQTTTRLQESLNLGRF